MKLVRLIASGWIVPLVAVLAIFLGGDFAARSDEGALQPGQTFRDCSECPEMVVIPPGQFLMGSSEEETRRDIKATLPSEEAGYAQGLMAHEHPQHLVEIKRSFALSKYSVMRGQFAAFVQDTGYSTDGGCTFWIDHSYPFRREAGWQSPGFVQTDHEPVVCVSWFDAKAYVAWLNNKVRDQTLTGDDGPYRLPSEAEWEYAARAGTRTARWWGDSIGSGNADCDGCGSRWDKKRPAPSGSFQINPFGLSDVLGNAWEWTEDCWNETYADAPKDGHAWTVGNCNSRVMKGGSWNGHPWVVRSANRTGGTADKRTNYITFRVLRTSP